MKGSNRYKEADKLLKQAKQKYDPSSTSLTWHSLGGSIIQGIGKNDDSIISLDVGYTIGQKTKGKAYWTSGDIVSLLGSNGKHMTTLKNNNNINGGLLVGYYAHNVDNIKYKRIII